MDAGIIDNWVADKGFGFIKPRSGGPNVFLHISSIMNANGGEQPQKGDVVLFDTIADPGQRPRAQNAILIMNGGEDEIA